MDPCCRIVRIPSRFDIALLVGPEPRLVGVIAGTGRYRKGSLALPDNWQFALDLLSPASQAPTYFGDGRAGRVEALNNREIRIRPFDHNVLT